MKVLSFSFMVLLVCITVIGGGGATSEFTTTVGPGAEDCFYVPVKSGEYLEIEYQVIDGEQGELDIDFFITGPEGNVIVAESRKSDSAHRTTGLEAGDYRLCFDNSFSIFSSKTVFFDVTTDNGEDAGHDGEDENNNAWGELDKEFYAGLREEEIYDIQVQDIKDSVAKVRGHLTTAQHHQDQLRAFEARDRNVAESNFSRVNFWSVCHVVALLITGMIQVITVRSLFDDKSVLRRLLKQGLM